jgi:hypothetical protein
LIVAKSADPETDSLGHNNNYINARKTVKDDNRGFDAVPDPQVIHTVDKKVTYQGLCLDQTGPKTLQKGVTKAIQSQHRQTSEQIAGGLLPEAKPRQPAGNHVE